MHPTLGKVFGCVLIKIIVANGNVQSLKCYPEIMHFWRSNRITMTIPKINKNLWNTIQRIENIVNDDSESIPGGYRYEYDFKDCKTVYL